MAWAVPAESLSDLDKLYCLSLVAARASKDEKTQIRPNNSATDSPPRSLSATRRDWPLCHVIHTVDAKPLCDLVYTILP